jgi:hypothetical protein
LTTNCLIIAGLTFAGASMLSCEKRPAAGPAPTKAPSPATTQAQLAPPGAKDAAKTGQGAVVPMNAPKAVIVAWVGNSDRPNPPIVLWSEKAALQSASDWIIKRGRAPVGVTAVEAKPEELACIARAGSRSAAGAPSYVEVSTWDGAAATSVLLDGGGSKAFLGEAIGCAGTNSAAAGYLKSIQTMLNNATR